MKTKWMPILASCLALIFYIQKGVAMSLFFGGEKKEAVLFSPLEGRLMFNGKPAAGAKIKLWLAWKDQEGESEYFSSDAEGFFSIPQKTATYKQNPLAQISIGQMLTVEFDGEEYLIWKTGKTSTHLFGELGGRPENVVCELTKDELDTHLDHSLLETLCVWDDLNKYMEIKDE